jgi:hypothetical protein
MMNFGQPPRSAVLSDTSYERGRWSWQRAARGAWIAFALVLLVIFVVNIPAFFQYAGRVCTLTDAGYCPTEQLTPAYVQILDQLHLSVTLTQVLLATLCIVVSILYGLMGVLIFLRKSHETMGLLVSLLLVMFASSGFLGFNLPAQTPPFSNIWPRLLRTG